VGVSFFTSKGLFHLRSGYTPKVGDIIYFSSSTYPNGGGVAKKSYTLSYASIYGYGSPDYGDTASVTTTAEAVDSVRYYTVATTSSPLNWIYADAPLSGSLKLSALRRCRIKGV